MFVVLGLKVEYQPICCTSSTQKHVLSVNSPSIFICKVNCLLQFSCSVITDRYIHLYLLAAIQNIAPWLKKMVHSLLRTSFYVKNIRFFIDSQKRPIKAKTLVHFRLMQKLPTTSVSYGTGPKYQLIQTNMCGLFIHPDFTSVVCTLETFKEKLDNQYLKPVNPTYFY